MAAPHDHEPAGLVLVVGPDPDSTKFITAVLNRAGVASTSALSAEAAARVTSAQPLFSMVVLDADLVALRSIRALADPRRAAVPTVVLGAPGSPATAADEAHDQGATVWIDRPVDEDELIDSIRRVMDEAPKGDTGGGTGE
jgi:DNA-binding NtrC family response regulator